MKARFAHIAVIVALAAGLAAVLSVPASAQQYPPPVLEDLLPVEAVQIPENL